MALSGIRVIPNPVAVPGGHHFLTRLIRCSASVKARPSPGTTTPAGRHGRSSPSRSGRGRARSTQSIACPAATWCASGRLEDILPGIEPHEDALDRRTEHVGGCAGPGSWSSSTPGGRLEDPPDIRELDDGGTPAVVRERAHVAGALHVVLPRSGFTPTPGRPMLPVSIARFAIPMTVVELWRARSRRGRSRSPRCRRWLEPRRRAQLARGSTPVSSAVDSGPCRGR